MSSVDNTDSRKNDNLIDMNESIQGKGFTVGWVIDSLMKYDQEFINNYGKRQIKKVNFIVKVD